MGSLFSSREQFFMEKMTIMMSTTQTTSRLAGAPFQPPRVYLFADTKKWAPFNSQHNSSIEQRRKSIRYSVLILLSLVSLVAFSIKMKWFLVVMALTLSCAMAWHQAPVTRTKGLPSTTTALYATPPTQDSQVEQTTKKYGLEAGLFESMKQKDGGESAKSLLKKYGIAYLATSIPLAIVSFAICWVLVDSGVDVGGLLSNVGIQSEVGEKAGTFAIAYAAHKAASPIRFPPTVLLTPLVAKWIGKEPELSEERPNGESS